MMKILWILFVGVLLSGCASEYKTDSFSAPSSTLDRSAIAYVAVPDNGRYGDITYQGSAKQTTLAIFGAISTRASRAVMADTHLTHDADLAAAKRLGASYLFEAVIINWEDRATEWSGRPDRITLKLTVYAVATGQELASAVLNSHSSWWTLGGNHPQDLLPETLQPFVDRVYGGAA